MPEGFMICFNELSKNLNVDSFKKCKEEDLIKFHHSIGRDIRNNFGLWGGSDLKSYFESIEIKHPDDMSDIILKSFHRFLNNKELNIEGQVKYFKDYSEVA